MSMSPGDFVFVRLNDDTDWAGAGARCHDTAYHNSGEARVYGGEASGDGYVYSHLSAMPAAITHACGQNTDLTIKVTVVADQTFRLGDERNGIDYGPKQLLVETSTVPGVLVQCSTADPPPVAWPTASPTSPFVVTDKTELRAALAAWDADTCAPCATTYGGAVATWDVTGVTDFIQLISDLANFDEGLAGWDLSSVTAIASCFKNSGQFNQPVPFDTASVTAWSACSAKPPRSTNHSSSTWAGPSALPVCSGTLRHSANLCPSMCRASPRCTVSSNRPGASTTRSSSTPRAS
jgi:hypothetical protein